MKNETDRDGPRGPTPPRGSFAGNAAWMLAAEITGKVASFAFVVVVANGLGPRDYGIFNFSISFVPLFLMFARWGLNISVTRDIAREPSRASQIYGSGLVLRLVLGALGVALAIATAPFFVDGRTAIVATVIVAGALFLDEISSFQGAVFKAYERMAFYALETFVNRLLSMALAIAVIAAGGDLIAVAGAYAAGSLGAVLVGAVALRRYFPPMTVRDLDRSVIRTLLREGVALGVGGLLSTALFRVDAVLLQALRGPVEVGLYGVAYRFFDSMLFVTFALSGIALPVIARSGTGAESTRIFRITIALSLCFYLPIAVGALFAARWAVTLLFDDRYAAAASAVPWLTAAGVFYALSYSARTACIAFGKSALVAWVTGIALVVNLTINAVAIPRYGFEGAAMATLGAQVLEATILLVVYSKANEPLLPKGLVIAPVAGAVLMGGVLAVSGLRDLPAVAVGVAVFLLATVAAARFFARDEAVTAMGLVRRVPAGTEGS